MKYRLKFDKISYLKKAIECYYYVERGLILLTRNSQDPQARVILGSLKLFKNNSQSIVKWVSDESNPLNKISKKSIDMMFKSLHQHLDYETSYYYKRPTALMYDILSIMIVADSIQCGDVDFTSGLMYQYLRCGNFKECVKNGSHEKRTVESLLTLGKNSVYWKRVEEFLGMTI